VNPIRPLLVYLSAPALAYATLGLAIAVGSARPCGTDQAETEALAFLGLSFTAGLLGVAGLLLAFAAFARRNDWLVVAGLLAIPASLFFPLGLPLLAGALLHQLALPSLLAFVGFVVFRSAQGWQSARHARLATCGVAASLAFFPLGTYAFLATAFRCGIF
jgi:hypothetical protein